MKAMIATLSALSVLAFTPAAGQSYPTPPPQAPQMTHMQQRLQTMTQHLSLIHQQVRQLNQWMHQHQTQQAYRAMGQAVEQTCEHLQLMLREVDQVRNDPAFLQNRDQQRDMDHLQERLRTMINQTDEVQEALRSLVGA